MTVDFNVPPRYGWVKVWIKNEGNNRVDFSINRTSNQFQVMSGHVAAGDDHSIQVSSEGHMGGELAVKLAQDKNNFK